MKQMKIKIVKKGTIKPIKPFKSLEEEANFWDKNDIIDLLGKDIKVGIHRTPKTDTLTIRFDPKDIQKLREEAFNLGLGPTTLVRMWVMEKLGLANKGKQSSKVSSSQAILHRIKPAK